MANRKDTPNGVRHYSAPGRICLFGDHQDYLHLPIIACAIDRQITITARQHQSNTFNIHLADLQKSRKIDIHDDHLHPIKGDLLISALRVVRRYGCLPDKGYDITISGNIPINAGLSSSSALVVCWIRFLIGEFGCDIEVTPSLIAKMAYEAEVVDQGSAGGRMDQYTISIGGMIFLKTDDSYDYESLDTKMPCLIIGESGVPKDTTGNLRHLKERAWQAIEEVRLHDPLFGIARENFSAIDMYKDIVPDRLMPYFRAAITNHLITLGALDQFRKKERDYKIIGELMTQHHNVLRDLLGITVPKIDTMINAALAAGVLGAKIVGSGGGGCIVALAEAQHTERIKQAILEAGAKDAYTVKIAAVATMS